MMYLADPYPKEGKVKVLNLTSQLVDSVGTPVPLSDVYVHHYVSSSKFILGSGAELRGSFHRQPLAEPFALTVDTQDLKDDIIRYRMCFIFHVLGQRQNLYV